MKCRNLVLAERHATPRLLLPCPTPARGGQGQAQGLGQQATPATAGTAPGADLAMYRQLAMLLMQMAQAQQQAGHQQQAQTLHSIAVSLSQGQLPPGISLQQLQQLVVLKQHWSVATCCQHGLWWQWVSISCLAVQACLHCPAACGSGGDVDPDPGPEMVPPWTSPPL
ncbi:hypothetical protein HaLaN_16025 [Haematococcus lacustris]|uniref:Uncharacterized protein n=1 Tax=Haematococcus lacustris TaxID=44745 RepID=A0A699ZJX9_HAELA|nr:hypothetical protein HaLaN_16025 [Haematococcus lacustris]